MKKTGRTEKEECESMYRYYLKVKDPVKVSLEFTAALAMKQRTGGIANGPEAKTLEINPGSEGAAAGADDSAVRKRRTSAGRRQE